jgi:outer membrane protein assembly factor BamE (lipoprotein component of BamABCDE complex)
MEAMTRRRVLFGLLLVSVVLACFAGWLWMARDPRVTRERFEQVKEGMSREEVIRKVGAPPGNYSDGLWSLYAFGPERTWWVCDDAALAVDFDDAGTATNVVVLDPHHDVHFSLSPRLPRAPTLTERIRRWLGL